nr:hypothetical protein [uncultured Sphingomonas sp.]
MKAVSPYQMFSPIHVAWLYHRRETGKDITAADLASIAANQADAPDDPLFRDLAAKAAARNLQCRRGRKFIWDHGFGRLTWASLLIDDEVRSIWHERRSNRRIGQRTDESPIHEAAETVARELQYGSGRSPLNHPSRHQLRG